MQLPNLKKNCSEPLLTDGEIKLKLGAQNYEGIPCLAFRLKKDFIEER